MGSLYIEGTLIGNKLGVNHESAVCLALASYIDFPLSIYRIEISTQRPATVLFDINQLNVTLVERIPEPASLVRPPVLTQPDGISCVAGLAAVLRQMVKHCAGKFDSLLGFRKNCLAAPSQSSPFVWFCEVALVQNDLAALHRLEHHLSLPLRIHNAGKNKEAINSGRFVEGTSFILTDFVLTIAITLILQRMPVANKTLHQFPCINTWLSRVLSDMKLYEVLGQIETLTTELCIPGCTENSRLIDSLYRRPTKQEDFTNKAQLQFCLEMVSSVEMMPVRRMKIIPNDLTIPSPDVPVCRKEKKTQQIQCFVTAALKECREGDRVVDFCAGSGHVGLAVASCLSSSCRIIILDAKEISINRARSTLITRGLTNVWLVQANLDYFVADFQVGLGLHACGVTSDLIVHKCLEKGASFVLSPCCYGKIQENEIVRYPLSKEFRATELSEKDYIVLGHCADQLGEHGETSMLAVDTDRCLVAKENGYKVELNKMEPLTCSTRNNLIIASKLPK